MSLSPSTSDVEKNSVRKPSLDSDAEVEKTPGVMLDTQIIDEATNTRILRKIDLCLMPLMMFIYVVQFMDKSTNSLASVMGMRQDLGMKGDDYSWSGTAFYIGYLAFEFPAVFMLQKFPMAKTLSVFVVLWGMVLCCHAVPRFGGFIALRTILGVLESAVTPAFVILTAQWYKREEQFLRTSIWFASNGLGLILGSLVAYGLTENHHLPMHGWKLLFIITGVLTMALGIVIFFHIPDDPSKAWFLNEEERKLVLARIASNQQGFENKTFKKEQVWEALTDIRTWLYFLFSVSNNIPNGGLTNFSTILLSETIGLGPTRALLMQTPQGGVEFVGCIFLGWVVQRTERRCLIATIAQAIALVASCLLAFLPHSQGAGLCGLYLVMLYPIGLICVLSLVASNTAGHTKKISVNAILLIGYCLGNLLGPQTFRAEDAPAYTAAKICIVVFFGLAIGITMLIWFVNVRENRRRDQLYGGDITEAELHELQTADLTDRQNKHFRYAF
ncbi:YALI0D05819p [Yarrowia lipolytica CLIB122]|uniref:YALI0D05819p n=2 Tax=Yarrowia lipolytica TaxID=4952 RepID=Q6CA52_YARLI|nr:YALI0D05819p [Yarrowia lipolytica CLIB122]AOW03642.1 hypothetical protein YALI1_D07486g [Yarrowia lipolytica]KAB8279809.1 major facilitator superfamily domain-containing protein [Yarrowia lipolytica]KAE8168731.1 major facilitator superfamily domain-containing protein [Yarrowia lipolytica]KAJ8054745.1 major facilitator superfamily domain-containing protein [Yarrowia lipolytica]RMI96612.1 major facilitator superfamily domain-containing protein [Yarrowia lipolytica]|eukprot:XP_502460.1 YALI0D05819p [Yarrowia lipolytica CLIB122]